MLVLERARTGDYRFVRFAQNDRHKSKGNGKDNGKGKGKSNSNGQYGGPSLRSRMTAKNRQQQRQRDESRYLPVRVICRCALFAGEGGLEVFAGGVGLGLVSAGDEDSLVHVDGFSALVEEVVHLAGA